MSENCATFVYRKRGGKPKPNEKGYLKGLHKLRGDWKPQRCKEKGSGRHSQIVKTALTPCRNAAHPAGARLQALGNAEHGVRHGKRLAVKEKANYKPIKHTTMKKYNYYESVKECVKDYISEQGVTITTC